MFRIAARRNAEKGKQLYARRPDIGRRASHYEEVTQILKIFLGGSPCTHWSIAQTKHRETEPSGIGWELFRNYLIAKEKYRPDYFLYENNKSMANAIREQITKELGVEPILINSALVSAQNRQRLYWTNIPGVEQPEDRGILLRDVLDDAVAVRSAGDDPRGAAEVLNINPSGRGMNGTVMHINGKSRTITTNKGEGPKIIEPVAPPEGFAVSADGAMCVASRGRYTREDGGAEQHLEVQTSGKTNALTTVQKDNLVAQPLETAETSVNVNNYRFEQGECGGRNAVQFLGAFSKDGERWLKDGKSYSRNFNQGRRLHGVNQKSVTVTAQGCGLAGNAGLYAVPASIACRGRNGGHAYEVRGDGKSNAVIVGHESRMVVEGADGKTYPVYEVRDGEITIRGKQFPIKLPDGFYVIRKLSVSECKRLQTVPEKYIFPVSAAQAYKMLGNGWTVDVVAHFLSYCPEVRGEDIEVLSMYDGMSCGQIALHKLGARISKYYATEIDKYAVQTTQANYPETIQLGDAFQVRDADWALPQCA